MADLLSVDRVSKSFAAHKALDEVSLTVPGGSIYGLLGPNGAGKTTLIRIINHITGPDDGQVLLNGRRMNESLVRQIGYLPEERGLYKKMKVGEQALYLARLKGMSKADAVSSLKHWFDKFGIGAWWDKKVETLSKGMQQKVQFIVTVVHKPELLIFDEPFSGFDPINVNLIKDEILALKEAGATIIFSTHNMASVEELCDHIALIDNARKILEGEITAIKESYRSHTYEIAFVSDDVNLPGLLGDRAEVILSDRSGPKTTAKIKLSGEQVKREVLQKLAAGTDLLSFREIFPAVNDIFIRKVNENKAHNQRSHE